MTDLASIRILSAKYGLVGLGDVIEPYELSFGQRSAISTSEVRSQVNRTGLAVVERVIVLAGQRYASLVKDIWPYGETPLAGTRGIGEQLARLKELAGTRRNGDATDGGAEEDLIARRTVVAGR